MEKFGKLLTETIRHDDNAKAEEIIAEVTEDATEQEKVKQYDRTELKEKEERQSFNSSSNLFQRSKSHFDLSTGTVKQQKRMSDDSPVILKESIGANGTIRQKRTSENNSSPMKESIVDANVIYIFMQKQSNHTEDAPMTFKKDTLLLSEKSEASNNRIKENIEVFINLSRKFSLKIKSYAEFIISLQSTIQTQNSNSKTVMDEFKETLRTYQALLENPNLVSNLLDTKAFHPLKENIYIQQFSLSTMFNNLEKVIDELQTKNNILDQEKSVNNQRLQEQSLIKKKYEELKIVHEKNKNEYLKTTQINIFLESKISILEEENGNLRKSISCEKENFDNLLKQKITTFNKEAKYKDSKIRYYENLVQSNKRGDINYDGSDSRDDFSNASLSKWNNQNNREIDLKRSITSYKSISPFKAKHILNNENKPKHIIHDSIKQQTITNKNDITQTSFKSDIDHLDIEISDLKNQLKAKMEK